jgi:hypothetical protein
MAKAFSFQLATWLLFCATTGAFHVRPGPPVTKEIAPLKASHYENELDPEQLSRRRNMQQIGFSLLSLMVPFPANAEDFAARDAQRKYVQESYEDFTKTPEGWLYREVKPGSGEGGKEGDRVVFDYSGYTIGYFGRPFQAKGSV